MNAKNAKVRPLELYTSLFLAILTLIMVVFSIIIGKPVEIFALFGIAAVTFLMLVGHIYWHKEIEKQ